MRLDITAYKQVRLARATGAPTDEELDDDRFVYLYPVPAFIASTDRLPEGLYTVAGEAFGFRAGSYSGYMHWREALAAMVGIASLREFWLNPHPGPFTELLNNADNEGFIGPKTSAKLAADFAAHHETAARTLEPWAFELYLQWRKAFELAADGGAVKLH